MTGPIRFDALEPKWVVMRVLQNDQPWHTGVTALMKDKTLMPRDVAIWTAVMERINWKTGHCETTLKRLSEEIGIGYHYVVNGMRRLKQAHLCITQHNAKTGERWIVVNPSVVWSGSAQRTALLEQEWVAALKEIEPDQLVQQIEDQEAQDRVNAANQSNRMVWLASGGQKL